MPIVLVPFTMGTKSHWAAKFEAAANPGPIIADTMGAQPDILACNLKKSLTPPLAK
jgi:hypothetical protein